MQTKVMGWSQLQEALYSLPVHVRAASIDTSLQIVTHNPTLITSFIMRVTKFPEVSLISEGCVDSWPSWPFVFDLSFKCY